MLSLVPRLGPLILDNERRSLAAPAAAAHHRCPKNVRPSRQLRNHGNHDYHDQDPSNQGRTDHQVRLRAAGLHIHHQRSPDRHRNGSGDNCVLPSNALAHQGSCSFPHFNIVYLLGNLVPDSPLVSLFCHGNASAYDAILHGVSWHGFLLLPEWWCVHNHQQLPRRHYCCRGSRAGGFSFSLDSHWIRLQE